MARIKLLSLVAAAVAVGLAFATPPPAAASGGPKTAPIVGKSTTTIAPSFAGLAFEGADLGIHRLVLTAPTALVGNERLLARGTDEHLLGRPGTKHPISPLAPEVALLPEEIRIPGEGHTAKADGGTEIIEGGLT